MIVVRQRGGIGNQLFIYATAYAISRDYGIKVVLDDMEFWNGERYSIDKYNVVLTEKFLKINDTFKKYFLNKLRILKLNKLIYNTKYKRQMQNLNAVSIIEKNHEFIDFDFDENKNYYLDGFWQSSNYFHKYRDELRKQLVLKNISDKAKELADKVEQSEYCAIHVRRGDYIVYHGGSTLDMSYYKSAIKLIEETAPNIKFIVFSDDIDFCRENFGNDPKFEYVTGKSLTDNEELHLMSRCKHYIIANSSFSWWGAYLGYGERSKVVCPVVGMWKENFYLDEWVKIPAEFSKHIDDKDGN